MNEAEEQRSKARSPQRTLTRTSRLQSSHMDDEDEDFAMEDGKEDSMAREDEESEEEFEVSKRARASRAFSTSKFQGNDDEDEEDEDDDNDDDNDVEAPPVEGVYDPREFDHLTVDPEVTLTLTLKPTPTPTPAR